MVRARPNFNGLSFAYVRGSFVIYAQIPGPVDLTRITAMATYVTGADFVSHPRLRAVRFRAPDARKSRPCL